MINSAGETNCFKVKPESSINNAISQNPDVFTVLLYSCMFLLKSLINSRFYHLFFFLINLFQEGFYLKCWIGLQ